MSSTWSFSRRVGAFRTATQTLYCLFETTCESNVHPHTPHEDCIAFGTFEYLVPYIMDSMSSCMGGMLRGAGGRSLTPLGYLRTWMSAFANPISMENREIELRAGGGWRSPLPVDEGKPIEDANSVQFAVRILRGHGRNQEADALLKGSRIVLNLYEDGDMLAEIYGTCSGSCSKIAPWRVIQPTGLTFGSPGLAPPLPAVSAADYIPEPTIYELGVRYLYEGEPLQYLLIDADGKTVNGSFDTIADHYLETCCTPWEQDHPGAGIASFKALMKRANVAHPSLPKGTMVRVDIRGKVRDEWKEKEFAKLIAALDNPELDGDGVLTYPFESLVSRGQYWTAARLDFRGRLNFVLPANSEAEVAQVQQTDLFSRAAA